MESKKIKSNHEQIKITAIYMLFGVLWIKFSDGFLWQIGADEETISKISLYKGWAYVAITGILLYYLINRAMQEVLSSQKKLHYLAYHDALTGLPNRVNFYEKFSEVVDGLSADNIKGALLYIDTDNFKDINDTLGHSFGDRFIVQFADRLLDLADEKRKLFRLSGDEFIFFLVNTRDISVVESFAEDILEGIRRPFYIDENTLNISASIGIALFPDHGRDIGELLKNADTATYQAKYLGKNKFVLFNQAMNQAIVDRINTEKNLKTALSNGEFVLYYQPQVDMQTRKITGFEALIRWDSRNLGLLLPDKFIKIAEETGLIVPIGEWVLKNACSFIKKLHKKGYTDCRVSVNISVRQLQQDSFVKTVSETLEEAGIPPACLEIEITESIFMETFYEINERLNQLRKIGVNIALDDFGKGYSSLTNLEQLPINTLKIDKLFIDNIAGSRDNKSIMGLIIQIGHTMGLNVVAEGVETEEQYSYLRRNNCDIVQGFLLGRPVAEETAASLLARCS